MNDIVPALFCLLLAGVIGGVFGWCLRAATMKSDLQWRYQCGEYLQRAQTAERELRMCQFELRRLRDIVDQLPA